MGYNMKNKKTTDLEKSMANISLRTSPSKIVLPTDLERKDSKIIIDKCLRYKYSMLLIECRYICVCVYIYIYIYIYIYTLDTVHVIRKFDVV